MTVVYEVGSMQAVKDLVFGWCVRRSIDPTDQWVVITDLSITDLEALVNWFRSLLHAEFREACNTLIALKKSEQYSQTIVNLTNAVEGFGATAKETAKTLAEKSVREQNRATVAEELAKQLKTGIPTSGWKVRVLDDGRMVLGSSSAAGSQRTEIHDNVEKCIDRILAQWW